jgi:hypothetical protein
LNVNTLADKLAETPEVAQSPVPDAHRSAVTRSLGTDFQVKR